MKPFAAILGLPLVLASATLAFSQDLPPGKLDQPGYGDAEVAPPDTTALPDLIDGSDAEAILSVAQEVGDASLEEQSDGAPKLTGSIGDNGYSIYFLNCKGGEDCEDLNFYAVFLDLSVDADTINTWNLEKRFGKAYLDEDGDAVVEMDLNLVGGVSAENLSSDFAVWQMVLEQFANHISPE